MVIKLWLWEWSSKGHKIMIMLIIWSTYYENGHMMMMIITVHLRQEQVPLWEWSSYGDHIMIMIIIWSTYYDNDHHMTMIIITFHLRQERVGRCFTKSNELPTLNEATNCAVRQYSSANTKCKYKTNTLEIKDK